MVIDKKKVTKTKRVEKGKRHPSFLLSLWTSKTKNVHSGGEKSMVNHSLAFILALVPL